MWRYLYRTSVVPVFQFSNSDVNRLAEQYAIREAERLFKQVYGETLNTTPWDESLGLGAHHSVEPEPNSVEAASSEIPSSSLSTGPLGPLTLQLVQIVLVWKYRSLP